MRVHHRDSDEHVIPLDAAIEALTFSMRWAPHGGATADAIFLAFGLIPETFNEHLHRAAAHPDALDLLDLSLAEYAQLHNHIENLSPPLPTGRRRRTTHSNQHRNPA